MNPLDEYIPMVEEMKQMMQKDCYPELGYKNNKLKRDTEAVKEFVESDTFKKLMESLDEQDRADKEDVEQFLRDIKEQEE